MDEKSKCLKVTVLKIITAIVVFFMFYLIAKSRILIEIQIMKTNAV